MANRKTVLDECIKWNRKKMKEARVTGDTVAEDRYADNIKNLVEYKDKMNDAN
jgi:hypothetical protein